MGGPEKVAPYLKILQVASRPMDEVSDVRALKQELHRLLGLPTRFRQRLFACGNPLDDSAQLDSPMEMELVLLSYSAASQAQADELITACTNGSTSEVRV